PRPRPAPAPGIETGTVTQSGAELIELVGDAGRFGVGMVPAGTYRVLARFSGGEPISAGEITVTAGQRIELRCDPRFKRCMTR
ncbi:MAG: carboxypeptidase-like regulatory domain-containing protein, partial [Myxococcota bacterium]